MKYLAILKDSLRESLDSKVLYVMFGFSALTMFAVAGISFRPESPEPALQEIVSRFPGHTASFPTLMPTLTYTVEDFQQLNEGAKPWNGQFRLRIRVAEKVPLALRWQVLQWRLRDDRPDSELTA